MLLAIGIGNARIQYGVYREDGLIATFSTAADPARTSDEYAASILGILALYGIQADSLHAAILSSVVPPLTGVIDRAAEKITGMPPMQVGPGAKTGLNIRIENPAQLGSDLVASAVAGVAHYPKPLILIDSGIATTLSVLNERGDFLGTVIVPGPRIALSALSAHAANLPDISLETPKSLIGKNTVDSMQSGTIYGAAAMLDGLIDRILREQRFPPGTCAVMTGEFAGLFAPHCRHRLTVDPNLLLDGLHLLYLKNTQPPQRGNHKEVHL